MPPSFANRHVVVTGGTGALGSAVVKLLVDAGATCTVPCLHQEELARFPHASHANVGVVMGCQLTDEAAVVSLYAAIPTLWASIHCAGGFLYSPIGDTTLDAYTQMLDGNARTSFLCCREAVRRMRVGSATDAGRGRIVNVAARPAVEPRAGANMTAYAMGKSAVATLTTALAEEVAAEGILVNAVLPAIMDTPANRKAMPAADFSTWPKVQDVAATIAFLASPENTATRGGLVPVYGRA